MNTPSKFRASLFAAALAVVAISPATRAQDVGMLGQVNVPFAFAIASEHFTAGVYKIQMENEHILLVQGTRGSGLVMTSVGNDREPATKSKVTFRKYGDQYFLADISVAGKSRHIHLPTSKEEGQLKIGGSKTAPTGVELAMLQGSR